MEGYVVLKNNDRLQLKKYFLRPTSILNCVMGNISCIG
jgi:hypothetical protein